MNRVAYRRWKDFSYRMAQKGFLAQEVARKEHQESVIPCVEYFFDRIEQDDFKGDIIRILSWDDTRVDNRNAEQFAWGWRGTYGPCVCDIVSEILSDYNPFYWDGEESDKEYEEWDDEWGGRIRCCLRAGIDLASESSAGVVGFAKADLIRMYPDGVPGWLRQGWDRDWEDIPTNKELWL